MEDILNERKKKTNKKSKKQQQQHDDDDDNDANDKKQAVEEEQTKLAESLERSLSLEELQVEESKTREKKRKAIMKKLRQIESLEAKDPATLDEDQRQKLSRKTELVQELEELDGPSSS